MSKVSGLWNRITGVFPSIGKVFQPMEVRGAFHVREKQFCHIPVGEAAYLTNVTHCIGILGSSRAGHQYLFHKYIENSVEDLEFVLKKTEIEKATLFVNLDTARQSTNYGSTALVHSKTNREDVLAAFKNLSIVAEDVNFIPMSVLVANHETGIQISDRFEAVESRDVDSFILALPGKEGESEEKEATSAIKLQTVSHIKRLEQQDQERDDISRFM